MPLSRSYDFFTVFIKKKNKKKKNKDIEKDLLVLKLIQPMLAFLLFDWLRDCALYFMVVLNVYILFISQDFVRFFYCLLLENIHSPSNFIYFFFFQQLKNIRKFNKNQRNSHAIKLTV